jgi:hypothetical protein
MSAYDIYIDAFVALQRVTYPEKKLQDIYKAGQDKWRTRYKAMSTATVDLFREEIDRLKHDKSELLDVPNKPSAGWVVKLDPSDLPSVDDDIMPTASHSDGGHSDADTVMQVVNVSDPGPAAGLDELEHFLKIGECHGFLIGQGPVIN